MDIEQLFSEYQQQRSNVAELQTKMRGISISVTSPRREVTVTVGQGGVITDVRFPTSAYKRITPTELAALILATYNDAKEQAFDRAAELIGPLLPSGMDPRSLVSGNAAMEDFLPADGPRMAPSVREALGLGKAPK